MMKQKAEKKPKLKKSLLSRLRKFVIVVLLLSVLSGSALTVNQKEAQGFGFICFCIGIACDIPDVIISTIFFFLWQAIWEPIILENIEDHINSEENWIVEDFFESHWIKGVAELTEYLSAFGMYQMKVLGTFLDAKQQLETQRLFWQLHTEAHRDYHPSDDYCWFGTNVKSLAATEDRANYNRNVMAMRSLQRQLGNMNTNAANGPVGDQEGRWRQFVDTYCDPKDNNWSDPISATIEGTGLDLACDHDGPGPGTARGAVDPNRANRDIDFTRLIDVPRTLEVNFDDTPVPTPPAGIPPDEEDVLAMANNLYGNKVLTRNLSAAAVKNNPAAQNLFMALRSIAAKRSVAENSYNAIVALKSSGTGATAPTAPPQQVRQYMASALRDIMPTGISDAEIYAMIGENPSLYSQLEFLSKIIFMNPDFYANLYDSAANISRKAVAMKAIEMMVDRALLESELRQEMLMSVLLTSEMRQRFRESNKDMQK